MQEAWLVVDVSLVEMLLNAAKQRMRSVFQAPYDSVLASRCAGDICMDRVEDSV